MPGTGAVGTGGVPVSGTRCFPTAVGRCACTQRPTAPGPRSVGPARSTTSPQPALLGLRHAELGKLRPHLATRSFRPPWPRPQLPGAFTSPLLTRPRSGGGPVSTAAPSSGAMWVLARVMTAHARRRNLRVTMTAHALDALGSPLRRDILLALRESPRSVGGLADRFPVSRPAVSRHLRVLEDAGLVERREEGTRNVYAVRVQGFRAVQAFLDSFWDVALGRLEALSRSEQPRRRRKGAP